jgi:glutathione-regulated potassium-efflux system ancillary protein KefG
MKKTLVILAHPDMATSRLHKTLIESIKELENITVSDIYSKYKTPDAINVEEEQQLILEHDRIIFEFPFHWFSAPGLLKYWLDYVLAPGFSHLGADKLSGKEFKVVTTTGAPFEVYTSNRHMKSTVAELLKPYQTIALYTYMVPTEPFVIYDSFGVTDDELQTKANEYKEIIKKENWK